MVSTVVEVWGARLAPWISSSRGQPLVLWKAANGVIKRAVLHWIGKQEIAEFLELEFIEQEKWCPFWFCLSLSDGPFSVWWQGNTVRVTRPRAQRP